MIAVSLRSEWVLLMLMMVVVVAAIIIIVVAVVEARFPTVTRGCDYGFI